MTIIRIRFYAACTEEKFFEHLIKNWDKIENIKTRKIFFKQTCDNQVKLYFNIPYDEAYELVGICLRKAVEYYSYPYEMKVLKKGK